MDKNNSNCTKQHKSKTIQHNFLSKTKMCSPKALREPDYFIKEWIQTDPKLVSIIIPPYSLD